MGQGKLDQGEIPLEFQFAADVGSVGLNRAVAYEELAGDVFAGLVLRDQLQYSALHRGQRRQAGFLAGQSIGPRSALEKQAGYLRAYEGLAPRSRFDASDDVGCGAVFQDITF